MLNDLLLETTPPQNWVKPLPAYTLSREFTANPDNRTFNLLKKLPTAQYTKGEAGCDVYL
jgi:hypothetical protein